MAILFVIESDFPGATISVSSLASFYVVSIDLGYFPPICCLSICLYNNDVYTSLKIAYSWILF